MEMIQHTQLGEVFGEGAFPDELLNIQSRSDKYFLDSPTNAQLLPEHSICRRHVGTDRLRGDFSVRFRLIGAGQRHPCRKQEKCAQRNPLIHSRILCKPRLARSALTISNKRSILSDGTIPGRIHGSCRKKTRRSSGVLRCAKSTVSSPPRSKRSHSAASR